MGEGEDSAHEKCTSLPEAATGVISLCFFVDKAQACSAPGPTLPPLIFYTHGTYVLHCSVLSGEAWLS